MNNESTKNLLRWLQSKPKLDDLTARFPDLREAVRLELTEIVACGSSDGLSAYLKRMSQGERVLEKKFSMSGGDEKAALELVQQAVRARMAHMMVKQHLISEASGVTSGRVRFNLFNGYLAQKLLFGDDLARKPVSIFWFNLFWPLIWQRKFLMPLVQGKGIYCFYSRHFVDALARLIGQRSCLEIAAGDGTLSRFLAACGVGITATDDYSWGHEVSYPESVVRRDAQEALREYMPEVVVCSWPPAGNTFERHVFRTRSVQLYIVIGSRHRFAAGNWDDYLQQSKFDLEEDESLARLVLPPELDTAVCVFRRKQSEQ